MLIIFIQVWTICHPIFGFAADTTFIALFIFYNVFAHVAVVTTIVNFNLPPVPALVLSIEQVSCLQVC